MAKLHDFYKETVVAELAKAVRLQKCHASPSD